MTDEAHIFEPYDVTCARCGKVLSCTEAVAEEGDEWECVPCWERCNAEEKRAAEDRAEQKWMTENGICDEHPAQHIGSPTR
jgi:hypothetical protein